MKPTIVVVTHNNCAVPLDAACEQDITDYCMSFTRHNTSILHTYSLVYNVAHYEPFHEYYDDDIEVIRQPNYEKTFVHATTNLTHIECDVMFVFCHGLGGRSPKLTFYDNIKDHWTDEHDPDEKNMLTLWAKHNDIDRTKEYQREDCAEVSMSEVMGKTKIVVLMCCDTGEIVRAYFEEKPAMSQQFFYFSSDTDYHKLGIYAYNCEIVMTMLLDGVDCVPGVALVKDWTRSMTRILQIVKLFETDQEAFWDYLVVAGIILPLDVCKRRHQLLHDPNAKHWFRIGGHRLEHRFDHDTKQDILSACRTLTLATWDISTRTVTYLTVDSPELEVIEFCDNGNIDVFLKNYATKKNRPFKKQRLSTQLNTQDSLVQLLVKLQLCL
jgi:hypothetical protein